MATDKLYHLVSAGNVTIPVWHSLEYTEYLALAGFVRRFDMELYNTLEKNVRFAEISLFHMLSIGPGWPTPVSPAL
ncbi:hypothetical protein BDV28DRAFT_148262 [Aspergillus coremiiformis]|uniref:Uncharacterized protein n=1 Tax=Aspergillus coremiiformis TaxID=138285 RepID=A0A5N6Z6F5_9EURO|nr:hypothetical protein BDV28DRAFT_148262 [Aspergillus coremiiformis]